MHIADADISAPPGPLLPHTDGCFPGMRITSESLQITKAVGIPVWTMDRAIYSIVLHLADSIPLASRMQWMEIRKRLADLARSESRELTPDEVELLRAAYDDKIEKYLNAGSGECLLRHAEAASALEMVLEHGNGSSYALHAWTIMPNHVHLILQFADGVRLQDAVNKTKRISAHAINRALSRHGEVWMNGAYTRIIRTAEEYGKQLSYLWNNPRAAGLTDGYRQRRYVEWT